MNKKLILLLISIISIGFISVAVSLNQSPTNQFSPTQINQLKQIVHDYLIQNPEVLLEAQQALQIKEEAKLEAAAQTAILKYKDQIFNDPNSPVIGNKKDELVLVEFFDYQCPHCKYMKDVIQNILKANPNLKIISKELPIFGGDSEFAAKLALAAAKQNKYWEIHNALMGATNPLTQDKALAIAKQLGLNMDQLKTDMNSNDIAKEIQDNLNLAQQLGLVGTPTIIIAKNHLSQFSFIPGQVEQVDLQNKLTQ